MIPQFTFAPRIQKSKIVQRKGFPLKYGTYSEIKTRDWEFRFNLKGEIKFIRGLSPDWPHPAEQLKRTQGNDWVYYAVGDQSGDTGLISWMGEYYLPNLPYPSNPVWEVKYTSDPRIMSAFAAWAQLYADIYSVLNQPGGIPPLRRDGLEAIFQNNDQELLQSTEALHHIIGGRISVLPPDTRHVDYEVIPLTIADGCLYHCEFCCVKSRSRFSPRPLDDIREQIQALKAFYGPELKNQNSLFLGHHDALAAGADTIIIAAMEAAKAFAMDTDDAPSLFFFGSVDALLNSSWEDLQAINALPFKSWINIGFESPDPATLKAIGKPVTKEKVERAFEKMCHINTQLDRLEITGNFLLGETLPPSHYPALARLLSTAPSNAKGTLYLSPIQDSPKKRELLPRFFQLKDISPIPLFVYLIQRL